MTPTIPLVIELSADDVRSVGGKCIECGYETEDGAHYVTIYTYAKYGARWVAILSSITQTMPPRTPQISRYDDQCRLEMMEGGCFSARLEAEQRRKEWAEINKTLREAAHASS